jgi:hypothetical protein
LGQGLQIKAAKRKRLRKGFTTFSVLRAITLQNGCRVNRSNWRNIAIALIDPCLGIFSVTA